MSLPNIILSLSLILISLHLVSRVEAGVRRVDIHVYSDLPADDEPLLLRCTSKVGGVDLGLETIYSGQSFSWDFDSDDSKPLVYQCKLNWPGKARTKEEMINAFISSWRDHRTYNYVVKVDGIYVNYDTHNYEVNLIKIRNW